MGKTAILAVKIVGDAVSGQKALEDTGKASDGLIGKIGGLGPVALGFGAAVVTGVAVAGKALYDIGATWDDVADGIRIGTGATGDALAGLVDSAKNIASTIPAEIDKIGPVVADLNTRLGLSGDTLETVASQYLEAGRMLGETVDINKTSAAFSLFKITGDGVSGAMDDLFRVSQATGVGMNDLADIVSAAGPGLLNLGFSFQDSAALAGTLDKAGIDAGATLKAMQKGMVNLARAGEEPQAAFQRVVGEIDGFVKAGDTASAIDIAAQVFGTKGASQFVTAVQAGTIGVEDLMGAAGVTQDTILGLGQDTADAAEKWQILQNKAIVALEPIAGVIFDGAGKAMDWLLGIIENFDLTPFESGMATTADALDGVWPLLQTVGDLIAELLPIVVAVFDGMMGIIGPALDTIKAIIATVTAVIQGDWSGAWEGVQAIVAGAWETIKGIIKGALGIVESIIKTLNLDQLFTDAWNWAATAFTTGINNVVSWAQGIPDRIIRAIGDTNTLLSNAGRAIIDGFLGPMKNAWDTGKKWISDIGGWIVDHKGPISKDRALLGPAGRAIMAGFIGSLRGQLPALQRWADEATDIAAGIAANPRIALDLDRTNSQAAQTVYNITINGALDARAVGRQLIDLINLEGRSSGRVAVNGALL